MTPEEIAKVASRISEAGFPDFLNRWIDMTPERLAEIEGRRIKPHIQTRRIPTMTMTEIGPKEQALRAARTAKPAHSAPAKTEPTPEKESSVSKTSTKTKTAEPAKTPKAKPTARRQKAASKAGSRNAARKPKTEGVRPGSKLELIVDLLKRKEGCTTADALAATGWPALSFNQQAKAAGIKLRKEKDGRVTRYWAV